MKLQPGEASPNKFRQVVYTIQATVDSDDNNYAFHRNVSAVIQRAFRDRLTTVHVTMVDVQCKNFHLWPTLPTPALRHSEEERAVANKVPMVLQITSAEDLLVGTPLVDEIKIAVDEALTSFGIYSFIDKGPAEVMNLLKIVNQLKELPALEAQAVLVEVLDLDVRERGKRKGMFQTLVSDLFSALETQPEEWWNIVTAHTRLQGFA